MRTEPPPRGTSAKMGIEPEVIPFNCLEIKVVVDNTPIPVRARWPPRHVGYTVKQVGNRTTRHQGIEDIVLGKVDVARATPIKIR